MFLTSNHQILEHVLGDRKFLKKSDKYKFLKPWLGNGLLTSEGEIWKKHRRLLTPAFHFEILQEFVQVFEKCGDILVERFQNEIGHSFDVYPYVTFCTLDIIYESIMGVNLNVQKGDSAEYVDSVHDMTRIMIERSVSPIQVHDFLYRFTKNYSTQKRALEHLHRQSTEVINARKKELQEMRNLGRSSKATKSKKVFLDLLLEARIDGRGLTQEEVDTFLFAGHETTASAVSFTLFCLANHPDVQEKALEEQRSIFPDENKMKVTHADLQSMKYLELVIKESMRLYPPVPIIGRQIPTDTKFGDKLLPQGDSLIIFSFGIHREEKYFEDPEKFYPERFERRDGKLPYGYIPFSAGPRNCIGQKFAMLELKSVVSKIVRNFELQPTFPVHELQLVAESTLKSANGVKVKMHPRKLNFAF
ncbi:hypothetical protein GEV33_007292 [Tenebrio molitor]|uniref:Cytochrome P450 monooxygenase n=1 Tax=Tenebrio molitor TaxID=7067 RepID=A0A8J6LC98_TENMO|nr:hypothetical protein GEV33_007292 [Tenebrio molitor]